VRKKKRCTQCGKRKVLSCFYAAASTPDGHIYECKSCNTNRSINYYRKHKRHILDCAKTYALRHKTLLSEIRARGRKRKYELVLKAKSKPCMDCGHKFIPFVMDLDHVRGKKKFALSTCGTRSRKSIQKEIAKCDAICSNCHRIRTWKRMTRSKS
jgi:hypothetical protein